MENNFNINIVDKKNRLDRAVAYLKGEQIIKTQKDISKKMGMSEETISRALKGLEKYLTDSFLEKFAYEFSLNPEWLKNNKEEDELALFQREERKNYDLTLTDVHEKTGIPQKLLKEFQWGEAQLTDRQRYALTQYVEEAREYFQENAIGIPKGRITGYYYPEVNASAGFDVSTFNEEKTRIPIFLPDFGDNVIFINVYGDSMYPKYKSGDMIGIKPVEFQYIVFGHPYVVVFDNGDTNIKYVQKGSDEHHVILASENPKYEPREYPLSIIRFFFTVKGSFNKERM